MTVMMMTAVVVVVMRPVLPGRGDFLVVVVVPSRLGLDSEAHFSLMSLLLFVYSVEDQNLVFRPFVSAGMFSRNPRCLVALVEGTQSEDRVSRGLLRRETARVQRSDVSSKIISRDLNRNKASGGKKRGMKNK